MERFLLLWDEIDDLVGVSRCLVARAVMRMSLPTTHVDSVATLLLTGAVLVAQRGLFQPG